MDYFLGEIRLFSFGYAPQYWMPCNGQTLQTSQYAALYALVGQYYGGNGSTQFNLPNLNGRVILGTGTSPVAPSSTYTIGQTGGTEKVALNNINQIPAHIHSVNVNPTYDLGTPNTNFFADTSTKTPGTPGVANPGTANLYATAAQAGTSVIQLGPLTISNTGSATPHENRMPYLAMVYCICINGTFPPRQ